jgi:hypothetical protein
MSAMKITEMNFPSEWEEEDTVMMDEEFSATSNDEAGMLFEHWNTGMDDLLAEEILAVDEQIGSNLLNDEFFQQDPCVSPTGPMEELALLRFDDEDLDRFSLAFLDESDCHLSSSVETIQELPFEERYKATLCKLAESMKRSQETRKSLQMKTPKTKNYQRNHSVNGVLSSIEMSSQQLQSYLKNARTA